MEIVSGNAFPVFARGLLQTGELAGRIRRCVAENRVGGPATRDDLGFVPVVAEVVEPVGVANRLEALSAGRGATAGYGGEGIPETGPGAEIAMFFAFHKALL